MLTIRLARGGTINKPFYRIVVMENEKKLGGNPVEVLGFWNPYDKSLTVNKEKAKAWIGKGAKPTKAVSNLLEK